ncbi:hypothetical protein DAEQUDRAFT_242710 [Daedalea quercina L-15889]|uniref:Uncharacterized protein n=1 Tax=Daedalea quercina L-15889 TaxID=1314783 RepID=A0A165QRY6_9APHY|nr:hypothetical protein DAEQUDRAFT_242710 [Daedalea quercina L-15889]
MLEQILHHKNVGWRPVCTGHTEYVQRPTVQDRQARISRVGICQDQRNCNNPVVLTLRMSSIRSTSSKHSLGSSPLTTWTSTSLSAAYTRCGGSLASPKLRSPAFPGYTGYVLTALATLRPSPFPVLALCSPVVLSMSAARFFMCWPALVHTINAGIWRRMLFLKIAASVVVSRLSRTMIQLNIYSPWVRKYCHSGTVMVPAPGTSCHTTKSSRQIF